MFKWLIRTRKFNNNFLTSSSDILFEVYGYQYDKDLYLSNTVIFMYGETQIEYKNDLFLPVKEKCR